tara:strand:+ start:6888 stop:8960 length:2073 start_codon:yes stop_codon:yes gene_type:complete
MAFYDTDNEIKRRQMALAENDLRLRNDPGRIFMRNLASAAPQALFSALGNVGVNLAKDASGYHMFGGKDRSEATIRASEAGVAEKFPMLRGGFMADNYPGALGPQVDTPPQGKAMAPGQAPQQVTPTSKPTVSESPYKAPESYASGLEKQEYIDLGNGTFAVKVDPGEGGSAISMLLQSPDGSTDIKRIHALNKSLKEQNIIESDGGLYRIVSKENKERQQKEYGKFASNRMQYESDAEEAKALGTEFVAPEDLPEQLPRPSELRPSGAAPSPTGAAPRPTREVLRPAQVARPVRTQATVKQATQTKLAQLTKQLGYTPTGTEVMEAIKLDAQRQLKMEELASLEMRKTQTLTSMELRKKQELLKSVILDEVQSSYDFLGITTPEDLQAKRDDLIRRHNEERDPTTRAVLSSAIDAMPTQNNLLEAKKLYASGKNVRVSKVSISEANKFIVRAEKPSSRGHERAAIRLQLEIEQNKVIINNPSAYTEEQVANARVTIERNKGKLYEMSQSKVVATQIQLTKEGEFYLQDTERRAGLGEGAPGGKPDILHQNVKDHPKAYKQVLIDNPKAKAAHARIVTEQIAKGFTVDEAERVANGEVFDETSDTPAVKPVFKKSAKGKGTTKPAYPNLTQDPDFKRAVVDSSLTLEEKASMDKLMFGKTQEQYKKLFYDALALTPTKGKNRVVDQNPKE